MLFLMSQRLQRPCRRFCPPAMRVGGDGQSCCEVGPTLLVRDPWGHKDQSDCIDCIVLTPTLLLEMGEQKMGVGGQEGRKRMTNSLGGALSNIALAPAGPNT